MNNYPEDIRSFDRDTRSPFYIDPSEGLDELSLSELIAEYNRIYSDLESVSANSMLGRRSLRMLKAISSEIADRYAALRN
jgi:hypothetical protein